MKVQRKAIYYAIIAAALYAFSTPISKLLLKELPSTLLASLMYLGAGVGMLFIDLLKPRKQPYRTKSFTGQDVPYLIGMIVLDIGALISLMAGLNLTTSANASLLNNFEIVTTALFAMLCFHETVGKRLWIAILLITVSSMLLSMENISCFSFSQGSLLILLACSFWGIENNCTRKLSSRNPFKVVICKGFCSGFGSLMIAFLLGERSGNLIYTLAALLLGFFAYGLSILFYVYAQRELGAAKTSAYYAVSPFIGSGLSLLIFRELPSFIFLIALSIMLIGARLASGKKLS
jgi:drug/metabolite transporter (DMT)-like permease